MSEPCLRREIDELGRILEGLDDLAIQALREYMDNGSPQAKYREKALHRVRRYLGKAIAELNSIEQGGKFNETQA